MREKLKALEELQQIDLEMNAVRAEAEGLPARRAELEAKVSEAQRAYEAEKGRLEDNERERRQVESLLAMERDKVKKWEGRLGEIKTPREYAALSREIDIAKKTNETQSEQLKTLAAAAGTLRAAVDQRAEELSEREMATQSDRQGLEQAEAEMTRRLGELDARRAEAVTRVDASLLSRYENIRRRRAGIAVSPVVGATCTGCNRNIPPQLSIVLQRADSVETCPSCNRIIYSAAAVNPPAPDPA
ncbi:zinc ribbon domain-containing protein [Anaeromyxobacter paludicola]|uniref:zinc ribbon domain-containing protein n=1 Tax=Anaeromyxobacter paludicola TaxID=2918171 RepID=UPI0020BE076D|nr:C4-type zinc ribbon domain-containing protein [Anaeromyxobacter paludicola]